MLSSFLGLRGEVTIEVISTEGEVVYKSTKPNTLVKESPKILLGNIVPHISGVSGTKNFGNVVGRPEIGPKDSGPSSKLAVSYMSLGYYADPDPAPNLAPVSADDLVLSSSDLYHSPITDYALGDYSVSFMSSFPVDANNQDRNYVEAALMCPALSDGDELGANDIPIDGDQDFNPTHLVMFAHQIHNVVQASAGSTIKYTWTISMQEPT
jgi:hypothetical protein